MTPQEHIALFRKDTLLQALALPDWCIVTACREAQGPWDSPLNEEATRLLQAELNFQCWPHKRLEGVYKGVDQGVSFLITGVSERRAYAMSLRYGQESVITHGGMLYNDGRTQPIDFSKTIIGPEALTQQGYGVQPSFFLNNQ